MVDINKYLGKCKTIEIDGDELDVPQLGIEFQKQKFKVLNAMTSSLKGYSKEDLQNQDSMLEIFQKIMSKFDEDTIKAANEIVTMTVKKMFPGTSEEVVSLFSAKYYFLVLNTVINDNDAPTSHEEIKKKDILGRLKEQQKEMVSEEDGTNE